MSTLTDWGPSEKVADWRSPSLYPLEKAAAWRPGLGGGGLGVGRHGQLSTEDC